MIDEKNLRAVADQAIPLLRTLFAKQYENLTRVMDAFDAATTAAIDGTGTVDAMQDAVVAVLGSMSGASNGLARAAMDMAGGTALEDLVRSHLYNPLPSGTLVVERLDDDGGGVPPGTMLN